MQIIFLLLINFVFCFLSTLNNFCFRYLIQFNLFLNQGTFLERGIIVKVQLKVGNASWGVRDLKCQSKLGEIAVLLSKNQLMGSPTDIMCQVNYT